MRSNRSSPSTARRRASSALGFALARTVTRGHDVVDPTHRAPATDRTLVVHAGQLVRAVTGGALKQLLGRGDVFTAVAVERLSGTLEPVAPKQREQGLLGQLDFL